jgi:hypothetical protein
MSAGEIRPHRSVLVRRLQQCRCHVRAGGDALSHVWGGPFGLRRRRQRCFLAEVVLALPKMVEWVAGAEEEIRARLTAWSGRSERGVQRPTNLAEDRQKGERDANGNDAMFDRAVIGVVFGERLDQALHRALRSRPAKDRGAREPGHMLSGPRLAVRKRRADSRVWLKEGYLSGARRELVPLRGRRSTRRHCPTCRIHRRLLG